MKKVRIAKDKEEAIKTFEEKLKEKQTILEERRKSHELIMKFYKQLQTGEIEKFAKNYKLEFSRRKKELIEAITKNDGYCPRKKRAGTPLDVFNLCPCRDALKEIEKRGRCAYGLFFGVKRVENQ